MIPINRTFAPLQAFVDELVRCGLRHAVTCPGSRNAPFLLILAAEGRIEAHSVLDERSAGFVALGLAKTTGRPVVLTCTSGSAAANFLPAVVEARESRVPLIVLTADRPPELRDVGAGQAIDQLKLYGSAVKWFVEVGTHDPGRDTAVHHRSLACRAYWTALEGRPGPVHLNFPLREPLSPEPEELSSEPWRGRADGRPWVALRRGPARLEPEAVEELVAELRDVARGAIVCGPTEEPSAAAAARLAAATGWPLIAEPTSGARCGPHDRSHVVAHYDALLRGERFAAAHRPELVVRLGDTPTSKPLRSWLREARQLVIDPYGAWHEPTRAAETVVRAASAPLCHALADLLELRAGERDPDWLAGWREADQLVPLALAEVPEPFEPSLYAGLAPHLPADAVVWVSSSMPIRDVETFLPSVATPLRLLANRGANGIDGIVSSALGAALARRGRTFLLTGELALLHDVGGLLALRRARAALTIVCVNNGGGGIFEFLPVARHADPDAFRDHLITPSETSLEEVAALAGLPHRRVERASELASAVVTPALVEVRTDRVENVDRHRQVFRRVEELLDERAAVT